MSAGPLSPPDRLAETLANLDAARAWRPNGLQTPAPAGAADCRIDLKLLAWQALRAAERSAAAAAHLERFPPTAFPQLWAGTVRDGVARGFAAHLEEAVSLAPVADDAPRQPAGTVLTGKELRRHKDLLVASAGARARFSRKQGLLLVDRDANVHSENCLWFEAREDLGTLDGFVGRDDVRARLFSAQFLTPLRYATDPPVTELELRGRLGRGPVGWPCRIVLRGDERERTLGVTIELDRAVAGWRLRSRWLGVPPGLLHHHCTPVRDVVAGARGGFVADTLVRACARLLVDGEIVDVPAAAAPGLLRHTFTLGSA